jgi:hypothetical protein
MKYSRLTLVLCLSAVCIFTLAKLISSRARVGMPRIDATQAGASQDVNGNAAPANPLVIPCVRPPGNTMVAWYPFDETSGTSAANLATLNTGTLIGAGGNPPPTHILGKVLWALRFDGFDDYVDSPSSIVTNFGPGAGGNFSIDAWIRMPANPLPGVMTILDKRTQVGAALVGYHFFLNQSGANYQLGLQLADGTATNYTSAVIPSLTDQLWHHVAVTVNRPSATGITWYHNGSSAFSPPSNPTARLGSLANNSPLRIGSRTAATALTGWFRGDIDELEIFNRELTPQEVLGIYNAQQAGKCKTLEIISTCSGCRGLSDFDGNGKDELAVFRPSNGTWYTSQGGTQWGLSTDKIVPGDYDGDGFTDYAVYRGGTWYILINMGSPLPPLILGGPNDIPVPEDYDGDGTRDIAVWQPLASPPTWLIQLSSGGSLTVPTPSANFTDIPVPADYDGDCKADLAVWRPSNGTWYLFDNSGNVIFTQQWGQNGDKAVPADYDGDGKADFAVWRPETNGFATFYVLNSAGGTTTALWGVSSDEPVPACYDEDDKADFAVYRPGDSVWYILRSTNGTLSAQQFGTVGDIPVPGAYIH